MGKQETLETIWEVPDELWERIEPIILEEDPPKARGRKRSDGTTDAQRHTSSRLRSGCQWNRLPKELGDDSTIHRTFQRMGGDGRLAPRCGEPWWRGAKSWMAWTGNGRRQTEPWARHVLGGPDWAQPYGPWQGWYQAQSPCGWRGRPLETLWLREQTCTVCQAVGGDPGRHCGRTTTAHRGGTPTPVSGQRV